ncbi:ATP-binding protein [Fretibacterium sp. OH1220_COT-178]|uniref:ATP-binding protein n=1 Tax=Fretibacterium sp. OH1220_COT-178 TaxID=2491047 RepID=UPI000F5EBDF6|nr:ATP-binding protein [Fretibacterium sp. OH1220_COT-178]RRD63717.1 HAMP domain-containing histidine kinase [Fretibacterium sp. OH1220_COT-178]
MGLKRKMALAFIVLMSTSMAFSLYFFYKEVGSRILNENLERMRYFTRLLEHEYEENGLEGLREKVRELGDWQGRVTLVGDAGRVLYDSSRQPFENHAQRPEIVEAGKSGEGVSLRYSSTVGARMHYYALALKTKGAAEVLRLAWPLPALTQIGRGLTWRFFENIAWTSLLLLLFIIWFSRRIFLPLDRIVEASSAIREAKDLHFPLFGEPELQKLSMALNDMAERLKNATEALQISRAELRHILEALPVGVLLTGAHRELRCVNPAALELLGADEAKAGQAIERLLPAELYALLEKRDFRGIVGLPHNKRIRLAVCAIALGDGCLMVMRDVSAEYRLETMRRNFTIEAGHELQTPLTAIRAAAELLLDGMEDEESRTLAETVLQQQERMTDLIDDLLLLVKLDDEAVGREELCEDDLAEMLNFIAEEFRGHPLARKMVIETHLPQEAPFFCSRPELLRALSNLLDNAVRACAKKYEKEGGKGGRIRFSLSDLEESWIVAVSDNGPGFDPEELLRLRQELLDERLPYYEARNGRREKWGRNGHGLGIAIAVRVARAHGGTVEFADCSALGGAELRLVLPKFHVKR